MHMKPGYTAWEGNTTYLGGEAEGVERLREAFFLRGDIDKHEGLTVTPEAVLE